MKITRKTNISFVTERKIIASASPAADETIYCPHCAAEMIPAQISAEYFGFSSRVIYRLIEAGKIHFLETESNKIYICPVSTAEVLRKIL
jgi:hypothetical protein